MNRLRNAIGNAMVNRNHKTPPPTKRVRANGGEWSFTTREDGSLKSFTGQFPRNNREDFLGTLRFLQHARLGEIEANYSGQSITLTAKPFGSLNKFRDFALDHQLLKGPSEERLRATKRAEETLVARRFAEIEDRNDAYAYKVAPEALVESAIRSSRWEAIEGPPGNTDEIMVMPTSSPELAFQVALYLKKHDFISEESFKRLNTDIKGHKRLKITDFEFRVAVLPEKTAEFMDKFPETAIPKAMPAELMADIAKSSNRGGQRL